MNPETLISSLFPPAVLCLISQVWLLLQLSFYTYKEMRPFMGM